MQMFTKVQTREAARKANFGSKVVDNGQNAKKRWGRAIDAKNTPKEIMTLKCIKDYRNTENAMTVQVLKVKKNKLSA